MSSQRLNSSTELQFPLDVFCLSEQDYNVEYTHYKSSWLGGLSNVYADYHPLVSSAVCVIGLAANTSFIAVLQRRTMRQKLINQLLIAIACLDALLMMLTLVFNFVYYCGFPEFKRGLYVTVFTAVYADLGPILHATSIWLRLLLGVFRCLIICRQTNNKALVRKTTSIVTITLTVMTAVSVPNILRNHIRKIEADDEQTSHYLFGRPTWWSCDWERANFFITGIMFKLLPCMLMVPLVVVLVRVMVRTSKRRSRLRKASAATRRAWRETAAFHGRTTAILVVILAVFLVTELPQGLLVMAIALRPSLFVLYQQFLSGMLDVIALFHCNANLILYCAMNSQFRRDFLALLFHIGEASSDRRSTVRCAATSGLLGTRLVMQRKKTLHGTQSNGIGITSPTVSKHIIRKYSVL